jgi:hypothetical protein
MLYVGYKERRAAVLEEFGDLVGVEGGVERDRSVAGGDRPQVGGDPAGMVVGKDGDACARRQFLVGQPAADGFGHLASFGVSVAFDLVVALDFERDVLRPALFGFDELVVERGHGTEEILQEVEALGLTIDHEAPGTTGDEFRSNP